MDELVPQYMLLDALLNDWDGIRIRMGLLSPQLADELARVAGQLVVGRSPDELAQILVRLLSLTRETPAHDYVRDLMARAHWDPATVRSTREMNMGESSPKYAQAAVPARSAINDEGVLALGGMMAQAMATEVMPVSVPIFFATNRKPGTGLRPEDYYGGDLAGLTFGLAQVTIPVARHRLGQLETPHWWTLFPDYNRDARFVVFGSQEKLEASQFTERLGRAFPDTSSRDLLIFMHGYNVTFEAAVRRAAQLSYDLAFNGVVILFSWPSLGKTRGYLADAARADASAKPLSQLLETLAEGRWNQVHLLAHSMGNRVLLAGLADYSPSPLPLGQLVLVAADVEVTLFEQKFGRFAVGGKAVTSYASKTDHALSVSTLFSRSQRVGYIDDEPYVTSGLETVDATNVSTSLMGHSYYGDDRAVLMDLGSLLSGGLSAGRRPGLKQASNQKYWFFPR